jgi:hypothetical protein
VSEFRFIPNQTEELEINILEEFKKCRCVNLNFTYLLDCYGRGILFNLNLGTV